LNMYYYPRLSGPHPLNMYYYPRRSGNSPRGSGNFLWRRGSYPVSEYSEPRFLRTLQRGASAGIPVLTAGTVALQDVSRLPLAKTIEAARAEPRGEAQNRYTLRGASTGIGSEARKGRI
jgi:hypothetical protein